MSKVIIFLKESYQELFHKVSWPKYGDLKNSSILVLIASLIFALIIAAIDYSFENIMDFIYNDL